MAKKVRKELKRQPTPGSFGIIGFDDHLIRCIIGVNPDERLVEQEILLCLQMQADFARVAKTDDLSHAICYTAVATMCTEIAQKGKYQMLETLACQFIKQIKARYKPSWIKVVIKKPSALLTASYAFVELEQGRKKR